MQTAVIIFSTENDDIRAIVIHNFVPLSQCELYLKKGDIVTEVEVVKDGWCKVSHIQFFSSIDYCFRTCLLIG